MIAVIHDPPNYLHRISELWAVISVDETGEGVIAHEMDGRMIPLIAADEERREAIVRIARRLSAATGKRLMLVKFSDRADIETITQA